MWVPLGYVAVEHQARPSLTSVHCRYVTPLNSKGKTQGRSGEGPLSVVQRPVLPCSCWLGSTGQPEAQSPQLPRTTSPLLSSRVAHHGVGDTARVQPL